MAENLVAVAGLMIWREPVANARRCSSYAARIADRNVPRLATSINGVARQWCGNGKWVSPRCVSFTAVVHPPWGMTPSLLVVRPDVDSGFDRERVQKFFLLVIRTSTGKRRCLPARLVGYAKLSLLLLCLSAREAGP